MNTPSSMPVGFTAKILLTILLFALALAPVARAAVTTVSYWRGGEKDPGAFGGGGCSSTTDVIGGRTLQFAPSVFWDSMGVGASAAARVGSTLGLRSYGGESAGTNAAIPSLTDNFGLELWVNPSTLTGNQCLGYNGNTASSGWGLYLIGNQYRGLFGGVGFVGAATATAGTWTHLALVRDNGIATLFVNGVAAGTLGSTPVSPAGRFAIMGQPQNPALERLFGFLDEVRVFTFAPGSFSTNDLLLSPGGVFSTADSGNGSLRSAITNLNATGAGSFNFVVTGTISLLSDLPAISNSVAMNGPGTNLLTISGNGSNWLFRLPASSTNVITGLKLASGFTSNNNSGAAIYNLGHTLLQSCALVSNTVVGGFGGAIANVGTGTLLATNCTFANNTVRGGNGVNGPWDTWSGAGGGGAGLGGAIYSEGTAVTLSGCSLLSNMAAGGNGGIGGKTSSFGISVAGGNGGYPNPGFGASESTGGAGGFGGGGAGSSYYGTGGSGGFGGGGGASGPASGGGSGGAYGGAGGIGNPNQTDFNGGGGGGAGLGAGLFARTGSISVVNCTFSSNLATNGFGGTGYQSGGNGQGVGGAIFVLDAALNLVNPTFSGNTASTAQPNLAASTIVVNTNDSGGGSLRQVLVNNAASAAAITFAPVLSGQTITLTSGQITLSNAVTIDASSLPKGIAIDGNQNGRIFQVTSGSTVVLDSLTITNGKVASDDPVLPVGGGIYSTGNLTLNRCIVTENSVAGPGGGIYILGGSVTMNGCTVSGNAANGNNGGGISNPSGTLTLNQCTLAGNSSTANGGGIAFGAGGGTVAVNQSTLSGNSATSLGGGIYRVGGALTLSNSIVAGNTQASGNDINGAGTYTGVNLTNGVPLLAPLGNYGGPTATMPPLPGSPATDGCTSGTSFATDQRGRPRIVGAYADLGAVEGVFNPAFPLFNITALGSGNVQFSFNNLSGLNFTVLASTNVAAPLNNWVNLGPAIEASPGTFLFTDLQATNYPHRFYKVQGP